jgi:hypothetical protein
MSRVIATLLLQVRCEDGEKIPRLLWEAHTFGNEGPEWSFSETGYSILSALAQFWATAKDVPVDSLSIEWKRLAHQLRKESRADAENS